MSDIDDSDQKGFMKNLKDPSRLFGKTKEKVQSTTRSVSEEISDVKNHGIEYLDVAKMLGGDQDKQRKK